MSQRSDARFISEDQADQQILQERRIAVLGYGNVGRSVALNLRDSGSGQIVVSDVPGPAWESALKDGFAIKSVPDASSWADVILMLVPDELASDIYLASVAPNVHPGNAIVFASGLNLAFGQIQPSKDLDVMLLAPRMLGPEIRRLYLAGQGFASFLNVEQDSTGQAWCLLYGLAKAVGSLRSGALVVTAAQEAYLDLFVEQTVGPDLADAILAAFQVGTEAGLPPEALLLELYMSGEMAKSVQVMADVGFFQQSKVHGFVAAYGGMTRFLSLDRASRLQKYRGVLEDITSGGFAKALSAEIESGLPSQDLLQTMTDREDRVTPIERRLREMLRLNKELDSPG
jgi:ketol-acid reductoisomerase